MTLARFSNSPIMLPRQSVDRSRTTFSAEVTLDNQDEKYAVIFRAPITGNISHVGWKVGTVSTTGDVDVRVETVSAVSGEPSGTLKSANANATETVDTSEEYFITALTSACAVTAGDWIAIVIVVADMNPAADAVFEVDGIAADQNVPYPLEDTGAGYIAGIRGITVSVKYDDGAFYGIPDSLPYASLVSDIFNNTDTPDDIGLRFQYPMPLRVVGYWAYADMDGDCDIVLYDSGDSELVVHATDKDIRGTTGSAPRAEAFATPKDIAADTTYRLTLRPSTTTDVRIWGGNVQEAGIINAIDGANLQTYYTSRKDTGAWTDITTRLPYIGLLVDQFDDGAGAGGGGGLLTHPGMSGGIRG